MMRTNEGQEEERRVSHMFFADNCYLFVASKEVIRRMIVDTTEELRKRGLDWKEDQIEMMAWGFEWRSGDLPIEVGEKKHVI